jgi:hypothetical protein
MGAVTDMKKLLLLGVLGLAGCASVDDIRSYAPAAQAEVGADVIELAGCLTDEQIRQAPGVHVLPIISPQRRRATVLVSQVVYVSVTPVWETSLQETAPGRTMVELRIRKSQVFPAMHVREHNERLAACVPGWVPPSA